MVPCQKIDCSCQKTDTTAGYRRTARSQLRTSSIHQMLQVSSIMITGGFILSHVQFITSGAGGVPSGLAYLIQNALATLGGQRLEGAKGLSRKIIPNPTTDATAVNYPVHLRKQSASEASTIYFYLTELDQPSLKQSVSCRKLSTVVAV